MTWKTCAHSVSSATRSAPASHICFIEICVLLQLGYAVAHITDGSCLLGTTCYVMFCLAAGRPHRFVVCQTCVYHARSRVFTKHNSMQKLFVKGRSM